jgi:uncharacterized protein YjdB
VCLPSLFILAVSCRATDLALPDLTPPPIVEVVVYTSPNLVQVSDTLRLSAEGFNSVGYGYVQAAPFTWSSPDSPKVITLEKVQSRYAFTSDVLVRGQTVGKATVNAVANNITGTGTVEVIPRIARIDISPSPATVVVGDTLRLTATVITTAGSALIGYRPWWGTNPQYSPVVDAYDGLVRGLAVGTVEVTTTLAGAVGKAQVTVTAR